MKSKTKSVAVSAAVLLALCSFTACSDSQEQVSASIQQITTTSNTAPTKQETTKTEGTESEITPDTSAETVSASPIEFADFEMPIPFVNGGGDSNAEFYSTVNLKLGYIDMSFVDLVGVDEFEIWLNSTSSSSSELTSVDEAANLYSFIKHFNISSDFVRENLVNMRNGSADDFSDEEIDLITSDNDEAVAEHFVSEMAILKESNIYSLHWIYNHSIEDYIANGITAEEIKEKLPLFEQFSLTDEAKQAIELKIKSYADFKS